MRLAGGRRFYLGVGPIVVIVGVCVLVFACALPAGVGVVFEYVALRDLAPVGRVLLEFVGVGLGRDVGVLAEIVVAFVLVAVEPHVFLEVTH